MMRCILLFIFILIISETVGQITFNKRLFFDHPAAVTTSVYPTDSCYYVTGVVADSINTNITNPLFCKFDLQGNLLFAKTVTVPNRTFGLWSPTLTGTADGNLIVGGYFSDIGINMFASLMKFTSNGDTIWSTAYPNPLVNGDFMRLDDMISTLDGGVLIGCTYANNNALHYDISLIKTDSTGGIESQSSYGDNQLDDVAPHLIQEPDSTIILTWTTSNSNQPGAFFPQMRRNKTIWLDQNINITNSYITDTTNNQKIASLAILNSSDGSYYFGGSSGIQSQTSNDVYPDGAYLYKLNSNKNWQWGKKITTHAPTQISDVRHLLETNDGNILALGTRIVTDSIYYMGYMQKISPNGDSLWQRTFAALTTNGARNEIYDARPTSDGGYIICGESRSYLPTTEPMQQGWLLKVDSMGCLVPGCHLANGVVETGQVLLQIKTYPNPATDYLNVYVPPIPSSSDLQLHLYNLEGKLVQNHPIPQQDATYMMQVDDLVAGVYLLQLLNGEGRLLGSGKVVVRN